MLVHASVSVHCFVAARDACQRSTTADGGPASGRAASQYAFKVHMLYGIPKVEIVKIAQEQNIDLVVMGSRGLNAVKR